TRLLDAIDPDLVVHQGASHTAGYAALWARHRGRRSLFWVAHEIDVDGQYEAAAGPLLGWLHRRALALAAEVVCTTRRQQSLLDSRRPGRSSVLVRYGVQAGEADPGSQRVGALWVGRAAGFKRPSLFVDLARALPEVPFTMVLADNRDGEGLFDSIRSRAQGVPNLTLCPNLDHPSSVRAVARTRVLVSTSTQEGLPLVFLEALAAGTPVASLAFDPDGLLRDHGVFGCAGGSLESLARMVVQLTSDDALFAAVSRRALDLWRTELSLDVHVQRFRDVVGRVAPGR
ncbi:MAG: glycosyltransferase, partial [Candidatus Riflebacteria bacterium]|nr:glycosyltransferase [Candidatus Riflebacteria bacterium]